MLMGRWKEKDRNVAVSAGGEVNGLPHPPRGGGGG
jgi:hypothetical protein